MVYQKSAHPGEGRDPDHMTPDRAWKSLLNFAFIHSAATEIFDLGPGLRRDERFGSGFSDSI
jgi:hypothetical protein